KSTHTFDPDNPHKTDEVAGETPLAAYQRAMDIMHTPMMEGIKHEDPDMAFVLGMLPHHVGATDMAEIQLKFGSDPQMRNLAERILSSQHEEIEEMRTWLTKRNHQPETEESTEAHPHH